MKVLAETPGVLNKMRSSFRRSRDLTQQMKENENEFV